MPGVRGGEAGGYVPPEVFQAEVLLGSADFYEGRLEESLRRLTEARELARAQSNVQYEAWTELDMARGMIVLDRLDEAVELLKHAQQLLAGKGDRSSELQSHGLLATAYLRGGEMERARAVADGVVEQLEDVQPAMFSEGAGFEGIALVYLAAWEREREGTKKAPAVAKKAWYACKVLTRFAWLFPLALPAALRCQGRGALARRPHLACAGPVEAQPADRHPAGDAPGRGARTPGTRQDRRAGLRGARTAPAPGAPATPATAEREGRLEHLERLELATWLASGGPIAPITALSQVQRGHRVWPGSASNRHRPPGTGRAGKRPCCLFLSSTRRKAFSQSPYKAQRPDP